VNIEFLLASGVDPGKLEAALRARVDLATARAADIVRGKLAAYSTRDLLNARTGMLGRAWNAAPLEKKDESSYSLTNPLPYAAIHEYGGTITPKEAKYLSIPLPPATTDRGVMRYSTVREAVEAENLFFVVSKQGNALLAKATGRDQIEAWFALKDQVVIPARHYATQAIEAARPEAEAEIRDAVAE
jgi:phage gpG-like protein